MAAPTEPRTLADTGGLVVTDDGRRVLVFDRCTGALTVLAFVLGVVTLVVGGFCLFAAVGGVSSTSLGPVVLGVNRVVEGGAFLGGSAGISRPAPPIDTRPP